MKASCHGAIKLLLAICLSLSFFSGQASAQTIDGRLQQSCWSTREGCRAYWNVYASLPDGWNWYQDKMQTDPRARATDRQLNAAIGRLGRCGVSAASAPSSYFLDFTQDLAVVFTGPYANRADARRELARSGRCGVNGYSKVSRFVHVMND